MRLHPLLQAANAYVLVFGLAEEKLQVCFVEVGYLLLLVVVVVVLFVVV